jgi:aryl-alcohol dehydrogenase-like predicted oxidoreductase
MGRSGPAEELKRTAAEDLGELADKFGLTMIELALAFVINHPAVTSAIIGPRTMEHLESQLTAPDLSLPEELLDAIDEIVPPGITLNPADSGWTPPSLEPRNRRR